MTFLFLDANCLTFCNNGIGCRCTENDVNIWNVSEKCFRQDNDDKIRNEKKKTETYERSTKEEKKTVISSFYATLHNLIVPIYPIPM